MKGIKLPPEFAQIDKTIDFGEVIFTPFWDSKGEKCTLLTHGPIFQFFGTDGKGAATLKGLLYTMNYAVSIESDSYLKFTSLAKQNETHKIEFSSKRKLYEAAIYANEQTENTFSFIIGFDEKLIKCNVNATYDNVKENKLEICNIEFSIRNGNSIIKVMHNDKTISKTRLGIMFNTPKHYFSFSNTLPKGLPLNMMPNTMAYIDLSKADTVHRFILSGPDISQTLILYFSALAVKAGSPMPVIKKYRIPPELDAEPEAAPAKPNAPGKDESPSQDIKLQAKGSRSRSRVINQPTPTESAKPEERSASTNVRPNSIPAASKTEEKVTPKPIPTVTKAEEKITPKSIPTVTKTEEKITPKSIPAVTKTEEKITPKPIPTVTKAEEKITPKPIPTVTKTEEKITPKSIPTTIQPITKIETKVITGKTISISAERVPLQKKEAQKEEEKKQAEDEKKAEEEEGKKDDDFEFVPKPNDKVLSRRRLPIAKTKASIREKKVEEKKESDDEDCSIDKILNSIKKATTPCGMPQKLAAARNELKELKKPEEIHIPTFEELLGSLSFGPPAKSPEKTASAISVVASSFEEAPALFDGLPELVDHSLEEITSNTIESSAGVPEIDLNTVLPIANYPPNDEMDFRDAYSPSSVLVMESMMIVEAVNSSGAKTITNSNGGDRLAFLTASLLMNGLREVSPKTLKHQTHGFFDDLAELQLDGLKECIIKAKAGADASQQFSLFVYEVLNTQLFVGLFRTLKKERSLIDKWYSKAGLISSVPDIEMVMSLLTPLVIGHEIDLVPKENLIASLGEEEVDHYIYMPAFDFRRFTAISSRCIDNEEQSKLVASVCASALLLATIPKGLTLPTQKSKNPYQFLEDVAMREGKIEYQGFSEMVQAIKAAKYQESPTEKCIVFFLEGIKRRRVHEWFFLLTLQCDLTSKYFFDDSIMRDKYKIKMAVSALAKMMK